MNILYQVRKLDPISTVFTVAGVQTLLNISNKKSISVCVLQIVNTYHSKQIMRKETRQLYITYG